MRQHRVVTEVTAERKSNRARPVIVVIVALLLAMWGYVLYLAFFVGRAESPDTIGESAFTEAADARCESAVDFVATLPPPFTQKGHPGERADTISKANDEFAAMLVDLHALTDRIEGPEHADLVDQWLDDYETYLDDRRDYARRLRTDPEARLLVSPGPSNRQVTLHIDEFAAANDMPNCESPLDV